MVPPSSSSAATMLIFLGGSTRRKTPQRNLFTSSFGKRKALRPTNEPANYEEAIFQQHADIDALLNKLVRSIAECDSVLETDHSSKNLFRVIKERLEKAKTRQNNKGSKARWRRVRFSPARSGGN
jgi:hypothetical protein